MRVALAAFIAVSLVTAPLVARQAATPDETPTQFYLRYHATVPVATSVQQIVSFWNRAQRQEFDAAPPGYRPTLDDIKAMFKAVSAIKVTSASATLTAATIEAEGAMDGKTVGTTVQLTREADGWKIASGPERWQ